MEDGRKKLGEKRVSPVRLPKQDYIEFILIKTQNVFKTEILTKQRRKHKFHLCSNLIRLWEQMAASHAAHVNVIFVRMVQLLGNKT